jgi:uncharacterized phage protein (TIGR01671 family)
MIEILFRGKRTGNGEWVDGSLHIEKGETSKDGNFSIDYRILGMRGECYYVDPETVGQYTGLTDKNGKMIFEGDMVSTDIARPYNIVEFRDGCFMFNCNDGEEDYYDIMLPILKEPHTVYEYGEVIGNIHDNPELLEV